jgi:hypothetical protein
MTTSTAVATIWPAKGYILFLFEMPTARTAVPTSTTDFYVIYKIARCQNRILFNACKFLCLNYFSGFGILYYGVKGGTNRPNKTWKAVFIKSF